MASCTSPAFYRLSEELLTLISKEFYLMEHTNSKHIALQDLRLSHSRFAYLKELNKALFCNITLFADREYRCNEALQRISQYVAAVNCLPTRSGTALEKTNDPNQLSQPMVVPDWTKLLQILVNFRYIYISTRPHSIQSVPCSKHDNFGDATIIETAIGHLSLARTKIIELHIDVHLHDRAWAQEQKWRTLIVAEIERLEFSTNKDFPIQQLHGILSSCASTLTDLKLRCHHPRDSEDDFTFSFPQLHSLLYLEIGTAWFPPGLLCTLLRSSAPTLEYLDIELQHDGDIWLNMEPPELPVLEDLSLAAPLIVPSSITRWITKCPKLCGVLVKANWETPHFEDTQDDWRPLFDAVRDHEDLESWAVSMPMGRWYGEGETLYVHHNVDFLPLPDEHSLSEKIAVALKAYVTGNRDWGDWRPPHPLTLKNLQQPPLHLLIYRLINTPLPSNANARNTSKLNLPRSLPNSLPALIMKRLQRTARSVWLFRPSGPNSEPQLNLCESSIRSQGDEKVVE